MREITVTVAGQPPRLLPAGTSVRHVLPAMAPNGLPVIGAMVSNEVVSLNFLMRVNAMVAPLTLADEHGWRIYRWSLAFLLATAMPVAAPGATLRVRHSLGNGLYCTVDWPAAASAEPLAARVARLEAAMRALVARNLPLEMEAVAYMDALRLFETARQVDTLNLLRHRNPPQVLLMHCGDFFDLSHEPLVASTGMLPLFRLTPCAPGFVLDMPTPAAPDRIQPFEPQPHLFQIYQEHIAWGRILGVTTVGQLNEAVVDRSIDDIILTAEALHQQKLTRIADAIARPGQSRPHQFRRRTRRIQRRSRSRPE